jgi:hypothetical protein
MRFLGNSGSMFHSYSGWAAHHFTPEQVADPLLGGPNADPDADGLQNALEHVLDSPPLTGRQTSLLNLSSTPYESGRLVEISFVYPASLPKDASLIIESSPSLGPLAVWMAYASRTSGQYWTAPVWEELNGNQGDLKVNVTFDYPMATPKMFLRLRAVSP